MSEKLHKEQLLGIGITTASKDKILEYIIEGLDNQALKYYIVTPNPEQIVRSIHDSTAKALLNDANIALPDGIGVVWGSKVLGGTIKMRISGIELMQDLCRESVKRAVTIGFLGGRDGVAEKTSNRLKNFYPGLQIGFVGEEWNQQTFNSQLSTLNLKQIDILFVAYGFPKQEEWMKENLVKLPVKVMMAVGGSFDILSGHLSRAPQWMQNAGLEWLYRLIQEPWRLKRQLALIKFVFFVLKAKSYKGSRSS